MKPYLGKLALDKLSWLPRLLVVLGLMAIAAAASAAATLTATPASVTKGGAETAAWNGIPTPTAYDWVGLYEVGAADGNYLNWAYTNGAASGSRPINVPDIPLGTYELRLFSNGGYTRLATSNSFTVATFPVTLTASPTNVATGASVTAAWSGFPSALANAWLGLYIPGSANSQWLSERFASGAATDSVPFTITDVPSGTYELRLFSNSGYSLLATSNSFTVTGASLTVSPTSIGTGGQVSASWSGVITPTTGDWLALATPGSANNVFVSWRYTNGAGSGSLPYLINGEIPPGTYELRFFANNTYWRLATSNSFTVAGAAVTLSATPASVGPGGTLTANWSGITAPATYDWVGLYTPGANNFDYLTQRHYTNGVASGSLPVAIPAGTPSGTYELRLFTSNSFVRLATSNSFTVGTGTSATLYFIHVDHLNTPRLVANQSGQAVWRWDQQEPFGVNAADENPSGLGVFEQPLRFPGQYADKETNLHYSYLRDCYDSATGRFCQPDPLGLGGGDLSLYVYTRNSPLIYTDPMGLVAVPSNFSVPGPSTSAQSTTTSEAQSGSSLSSNSNSQIQVCQASIGQICRFLAQVGNDKCLYHCPIGPITITNMLRDWRGNGYCPRTIGLP